MNLLWWPRSLNPTLVVEKADLFDLMEALMEFLRIILSFLLCFDLQTQHEMQATTKIKQSSVAAIAPNTKVSDAHAIGSIVSSGSVGKKSKEHKVFILVLEWRKDQVQYDNATNYISSFLLQFFYEQNRYGYVLLVSFHQVFTYLIHKWRED